MRALAALLLLVGGVGCSGYTAEQRLFVSCSGFASALSQLAPLKASMSVDAVARVDAARAIANPICGAKNVAAIRDLEGAVSALLAERDQ